MIWFFEVPVWLIAMILLVVIGCLYEVGFFGLLSSILEVAIFIFALFCLQCNLIILWSFSSSPSASGCSRAESRRCRARILRKSFRRRSPGNISACSISAGRARPFSARSSSALSRS